MAKHTGFTEAWKIHAKLQNEYQKKINKLTAEVEYLKLLVEKKERNIHAQANVLSGYMEEVNQLRPLLKYDILLKHNKLNI